jgi:hypothetical protein
VHIVWALTRPARRRSFFCAPRQWTWEAPVAEAAAVEAAAYPPPPVAVPAAAPYPAPPVSDPLAARGAESVAARMDFGDAELATVLAFEFAVTGGLLTQPRRADFASWLSLLAVAHPVPACKAGAAALADALPEAWPEGGDAPARLGRFRPCGVDRRRPAWGACAGSSADTRGYSCGVWVRAACSSMLAARRVRATACDS